VQSSDSVVATVVVAVWSCACEDTLLTVFVAQLCLSRFLLHHEAHVTVSNTLSCRGRAAVSMVLRLFGLEVQVPCPPEDDGTAPSQQLKQQQRPLVKVQHSLEIPVSG
jgi:hypothetical protein